MKIVSVLAAALLIAAPAAQAQSPAPETLMWEDLLPEGELERIEQLYSQLEYSTLMSHMGAGPGPQIGTFNVVDDLDGLLIRLPGFVLPLDYRAGAIREFLLVPYYGACIHTPPPPPNQIVYVRTETPMQLDDIWMPVWATGVLSTQRFDNELGDAAYTLTLTSWAPYD